MAGIGQFLVDYVQPSTEKFLGIDDEATKARKDARIAAQERINMAGFDADSNILSDNSNMNQDGFEDTLSHLLAGAYTTSEGGLDLGKRTGNALLNLREHFTDEGEEKNIDINLSSGIFLNFVFINVFISSILLLGKLKLSKTISSGAVIASNPSFPTILSNSLVCIGPDLSGSNILGSLRAFSFAVCILFKRGLFINSSTVKSLDASVTLLVTSPPAIR